ncbi:MAG: UbiA family prenyltransferase [Candidatus Thorarchaeota archaeon]|nr:MAG: UbiA family prenyltransferase [Candidatus Thorarchaeota archaeon]
MIRKTMLFRNLVDNVAKNLGLYSVGVLLLVLQRAAFEAAPILVGSMAFIIAYSSVYVINDILDFAEDAIDPEKTKRKPLARGSVERSEAVRIYLVLLALGLLLSTFLGALFLVVILFLLVVNVVYSVPLITSQKAGSLKLKHTMMRWPLVLMMQFLKILLPWTTTAQLASFPFLFAFGLSLLYVILFRGYKENLTVGESVKYEPILPIITITVFLSSLLVHPGPVFQAMIMGYLLAGIAIFWKSRIIDRKVLRIAPVYIVIGIIVLLIAMTYI